MTEQPAEGVRVGFRVQAFESDTPVMGEDGIVLGVPGTVLLEHVTIGNGKGKGDATGIVMEGDAAILIGKKLIREGWRAKTFAAAARRQAQ